MSEKYADMTGQLEKIGQIISEYKKSIMNHFKDMDVEVKDWHFSVGKEEEAYNVDVTVKLVVKPKTKAEKG